MAFSNLLTLYTVIAASTAGSVLAFLATSKKRRFHDQAITGGA
jgi:hypothetical protein